jgi:2-keto-4-pentenoate hydratase/2-oxohepta-3-ene-1,7-dioic acid hydratase in catechol pathway
VCTIPCPQVIADGRYTASNDVSSRVAQFAQSQWCYSKGFDGACPIGPALVMKEHAGDLGAMRIQAELNGKTVQESGIKWASPTLTSAAS